MDLDLNGITMEKNLSVFYGFRCFALPVRTPACTMKLGRDVHLRPAKPFGRAGSA